MEIEEIELSKIKRIKRHIKEKKAVYITGSVCLITGAIIGMLISRKKGDEVTVQLFEEVGAMNTVQANKINHLCQRISIYGRAIGRHGNPVREVDAITGKTLHEYATQRLAALDVGASAESMRQHLNGEKLHINGRTFERMSLEWIKEPGMFDY